jgi:hypothetical protein
MRAFTFLLCATLLGCRTSSLGSCAKDADCSSGAACDLAHRVCVATDAPRISNVTVATPAGFTAGDGRTFFDTSGAPLAIIASITGRAGVDGASLCLRVQGETGACAHPGALQSGDTYSFSLPRPAGPSDGTSPVEFTVSAASSSGHLSTSAPHQVFFDDQPPVISVAADPTPYARTLPDGGAAPIPVSVTIRDGSGVVSPQLLSGSSVLSPSSSTGNVYLFQLDPRDAPAGAEGTRSFHVRALDPLGHEGGADSVRSIDDAPPRVSLQIYKDAPDGGGVTYPAAIANTGWTGSTFVYSDTVHVQGTIADLSGIASATFHLDGIGLDGGVSLGTVRPLGCNAGSVTCPFSLDVTLNDAGSEFHTGTSIFDAGADAGLVPAGMLQFTIETQDTAVAFGGTESAHRGSSGPGARTTRFLWQKTLAGTAVSGLAVHPNGDLIVTMDGGIGNTVYALAPDRPVPPHWSVTLNVTPPSSGVTGTPAIGAGDGTSARVYVASAIGDLYAINPDGSFAWTKFINTVNNFSVGPSITQITTSAGTVDQIVVPDGTDGGESSLWRATSGADVTSVRSDDRDFHAAPLILGGNVYFATQNVNGSMTHVTRHSISSAGMLGPAVTSATNGRLPYFGIVTDGTRLYAATRQATTGPGVLVKIDTDASFTQLWSDPLASGLAGEPTFGIDGKLYGGNLAATPTVSAFDAASGAATSFVTLDSVGMTPLQGSDGHIYIPRRPGSFSAYAGNQLSWMFDPPGVILRYATMDCHGRVFVASGATVFALLSDDRGLADTPWPTLRRDGRNTGNAGAFKYGIRTAPDTCTQ